jgi:hypothetical protein
VSTPEIGISVSAWKFFSVAKSKINFAFSPFRAGFSSIASIGRT